MDIFLEVLLFVVPAAAIIGTPAYILRRKFNALREELEERRDQGGAAPIAGEKFALENRVKVLERIVTSRGYTVAEEIEALRDAPSASIPLNFDKKEQA
jgi:hypothetical protein